MITRVSVNCELWIVNVPSALEMVVLFVCLIAIDAPRMGEPPSFMILPSMLISWQVQRKKQISADGKNSFFIVIELMSDES